MLRSVALCWHRQAFCLLPLSLPLLLGSVATFAAPASDTTAEQQPHITVFHTAQAPKIDGRLDEPEWQSAGVIRDLKQIRPGDGPPLSEPTEVLFMIDKDAIYVGARMYDPEPERINRIVMKHGQGLPDDDRLAVVFDPFNNGRQGYRFETNLNGIRHEMLYQNNQLQIDWTVIWDAAAAMMEGGWSIEMAIPIKSLPFDPNITTWGLNVSRGIRRRGEEAVWVARNRTFNPTIVGQGEGFSGFDPGVGLDVVPGLNLRRERSYVNGTRDERARPSLDAYYRITPALTGSITINTDFSGAEVDDRQVNLTRFSLFFPEKRNFFLNDADLFEFGRIGTSSVLSNVRSVNRSAQENARPFFSRSLGLSASGTPVDIDYGAKLSGRVGGVSIGALAIHQAQLQRSDGVILKEGDALVARVGANVLDESRVGVVVTSGNFRSNLRNHLVGTDFIYSNSRLPGGRVAEGEVWVQRSQTEGVSGDDLALGVGVRLPNARGWRGGAALRDVQKNFFPALGFISRTDARAVSADTGYTGYFTDSWLQTWYSGVDAYRVTSLSTGQMQSSAVAIRPLEVETRARGSMKWVYTANEEQLSEPFTVYNGTTRKVSVPVGRYRFADYGVDLASASQRPLSAKLNLRHGDFYNGQRDGIGGEVVWRPSPHVYLRAAHDWNDVTLPQGRFITRVSRLGTEVYFNIDLTWISVLQYDDVTENLAVHSRLVWIPNPGQEYMLVFNRAYQDADKNNAFTPVSADLTARLSYALRF